MYPGFLLVIVCHCLPLQERFVRDLPDVGGAQSVQPFLVLCNRLVTCGVALVVLLVSWAQRQPDWKQPFYVVVGQ